MKTKTYLSGFAALAAVLTFSGSVLADHHETTEEVVEGGMEVPPLQTDIPAPDEVAAIPEDAFVTPDGIGIKVLEEGDNENFPTTDDDVTIWYTGWTTDGQMFDSSYPRGEPDTFPLGRLIQGWQKAVPYMSLGEKSLIWIPGPLAYDYPGAREGTPKGMLVFEIHLIDFAPTEVAEE